MNIRILPDHLINQIAAGEVVEDPASVVKELIENALDAGAQTIDIELMAGGYRLIRVSDDGCGMGKDDAVLCFERHATSKIRSASDLEKLSTMGFRGEALAAIGAISKVTLKTATKEGMGILIEFHGGKLFKVEPCARMKGTTIEVRDLFYNVPARRKFQKSILSSSGKIERWISLFSLGHCSVAFSFQENEKKVLLSQGKWQERIRDVFGQEFADKQLSLVQQRDGFILRGAISPPQMHRPQRSGQVVFVNGRLVHAPLINSSIREAYATSLPEGRYPLFVIEFQLPSTEVDVNVHPQKKEIRFRDEEKIRQFLRESILHLFGSPTINAPVYVDFQDIERPAWTLQETPAFPNEQIDLPLLENSPRILALMGQYLIVDAHPGLPFKGEVGVIDLRSALERILYDYFTNPQPQPTLSMQTLLVPIRLELTKREAQELRRKKEELAKLGLSFEENGECLFSIERIPEGWECEQVESALHEFLSEEKSEAKGMAAFRRCAKKKFLLQEAEEILHALLKSKSPYTSPFGAPILAPLQESDLFRLFAHAQK